MKLRSLLVATFLATTMAGPVHAQNCGFGACFKKPPAGLQPAPTAPYAPRPALTPQPSPAPSPGGFKPYEPYKGSSVYSAPKPASSGAKDCELSVYTNACGTKRRQF